MIFEIKTTEPKRDDIEYKEIEAFEDFELLCKDFEAELIECDGESDHVHLLINYPPKVSVSKLVNSLKGVSSRKVRQQKFKSVDSKLWGDSLWSPSYFARSCGGASIEVVKQYIESQETAN